MYVCIHIYIYTHYMIYTVSCCIILYCIVSYCIILLRVRDLMPSAAFGVAACLTSHHTVSLHITLCSWTGSRIKGSHKSWPSVLTMFWRCSDDVLTMFWRCSYDVRRSWICLSMRMIWTGYGECMKRWIWRVDEEMDMESIWRDLKRILRNMEKWNTTRRDWSCLLAGSQTWC